MDTTRRHDRTVRLLAARLETIARPLDFLGINYYFRTTVRSDGAHGFVEVQRPDVERTQMGWEVYPQGLEDLLDLYRPEFPSVRSAHAEVKRLEDAIGQARTEHPLVREAIADVDAANAAADSAEGELYPTIGVEAIGRVGEDIDGFSGDTNDLQARVVMRWNLFNGGINRANLQEQVRRASEARYRLHELQREAEEDVRTAWSLNQTQANVVTALTRQSQVSDDLLLLATDRAARATWQNELAIGNRSNGHWHSDIVDDLELDDLVDVATDAWP